MSDAPLAVRLTCAIVLEADIGADSGVGFNLITGTLLFYTNSVRPAGTVSSPNGRVTAQDVGIRHVF